MLIFLAILLSVIIYPAVGAWIFGYVRGALNDKTGWETPLPLFSAMFWPIALVAIILSHIVVPAQAMGLAFKEKKLTEKRKRIELQEKVRVELLEAEKEIERQFQELEELEETQKVESQKLKKATATILKSAAKKVDEHIFTPTPKKTKTKTTKQSRVITIKKI